MEATKLNNYEPTYWNNKGKYQKELNELQDKLIPESGKAKTMHGELLRCVSKVYYDVHNNGWCNSEVLQYQMLFMLNFSDELKNKGLNINDLIDVRLTLQSPPKKMSIWEDLEFVQSLDHFVDAVVLYVKSQENQN